MGILDGKVVLITGAGRGIGRAAALACARAGANLVVNDVGCDLEGRDADPTVVTAVASELEALGTQVVARYDDVTAHDAPEQLVTASLTRFGRIDALFHAAGVMHDSSLSQLSDDDLDRSLAVHLRAPLRLTRAVAKAMQTQNTGGAILLASAQAAFAGSRGQSAYAAAAAGITGFTRAAALELRRHNIRVNALCPLARTRMTEHLPMFRSVRADSLTAEHVAAVVAFLLSPLATEVTGELIGAAGTRVYALRLHETSGVFLPQSLFSPEQLAEAWPQVTKG